MCCQLFGLKSLFWLSRQRQTSLPGMVTIVLPPILLDHMVLRFLFKGWFASSLLPLIVNSMNKDLSGPACCLLLVSPMPCIQYTLGSSANIYWIMNLGLVELAWSVPLTIKVSNIHHSERYYTKPYHSKMIHFLDYVTGLELTGWDASERAGGCWEARLPFSMKAHPPRALCSHEEDPVLPARTLWPHSVVEKVPFPGQSLAFGSWSRGPPKDCHSYRTSGRSLCTADTMTNCRKTAGILWFECQILRTTCTVYSALSRRKIWVHCVANNQINHQQIGGRKHSSSQYNAN